MPSVSFSDTGRESLTPLDGQQLDGLSLVERKFQQTREKRLYFEAAWWVNIAYLMGFQWVRWNRTARRLEEPRQPPWRVRLVANRLLGMFNIRKGKLLKSRPRLTVLPASTNEKDISSARGAEKVLKYLWRHLNMDQVSDELVHWMMSTGMACLQVAWDPRKGTKLGRHETDIGDRELALGDIDVEVVPSFQLYPDPGSMSWKDLRWIIRARPVHVDVIAERFPRNGGEVRPEAGMELDDAYGMRLMYNFYGSRPTVDLERRAVLKEYWERPSPKWPEGRYIAQANGVLLFDGPNPYDHRDFPFVPFVDQFVPGRFWPQALIEHLIPVQKEYNKTRSQIVESKNLMSKPKWLVPFGSGITEHSLTSEPGEVVQYDALVGRPEQLPVTPLPAYVENNLQTCLEDMAEIFNVREISKGMVPAGVESGVAIAQLQERDDTSIGPVVARMEDSLKNWGVLCLRLVEQFYTEPRVLKVVGENNNVEVMDFLGSDIAGNYDVEVQPSSALPTSRVAKMAAVMQMYKDGLITDDQRQPDPRRALELMEFGHFEREFEERLQQRSYARWENLQMSEGKPIRAEHFEDHAAHMDEHLKFQQSYKYREIPRKYWMEFEHHMAEHQYYLSGKMQEAAMAAQQPAQAAQATSAEQGIAIAQGAANAGLDAASGAPMPAEPSQGQGEPLAAQPEPSTLPATTPLGG